MYAAILITLSAIMSNVAPETTKTSFEDSRIPVAVVDRDGSAVSAGIAEYLYTNQNEVAQPDDAEVIRDALSHRTVEYVLYIPAVYGGSLEEGAPLELESTQLPESYAATYVEEQVKGYVSTLRAYLAAGFGSGEALDLAAEDAATQVETSLSNKETKAVPPVSYYFNYLCYGLSMVMIFDLSPVLLTFGKRGLAARMNASALPLRRKNAQIALGVFMLAIICLVGFILVGFIIYRGEMLTQGTLLCIANAACYLFFSVSLGLLVGQLARSANMLTAMANVAVMAMCFLGGVFVPYSVMSAGMQTVAKFMPTYWYLLSVDTASTTTRFTLDSLTPYFQGMGL